MLLHWPDLAQRYPQPSRLERVQQSGTLRAAVPVDPGIDHAAFQDMHHALLREFANRLDVTVSLVEAESQVALLDMLARDEVDIAVPGRPLPEPLPGHLRAAPGYTDSQTHVVCNRSTRLPAGVGAGAALRQIRISGSDGYVSRLHRAGVRRIHLAPIVPMGTVALLERVSAGDIPCTLAQRDEAARARQRLPTLRLGEAVGPVPELFDDPPDLDLGGLADPGVVVEDHGDGGDRDAGLLGDLAHGDATVAVGARRCAGRAALANRRGLGRGSLRRVGLGIRHVH